MSFEIFGGIFPALSLLLEKKSVSRFFEFNISDFI